MSEAAGAAPAAGAPTEGGSEAPAQTPVVYTQDNGDNAGRSGDDGDVFAEAVRIAKEAGAKRQAETPPSPTTSAAETAAPAEDGEKAAAKPEKAEAKEPAPKAAEWAKLHEKNKQLFAREADLKAREAKVAEFEKVAKTDKLKALELLGYSEADTLQFIKDIAESNGQVSPERAKMSQLEREIATLRQEKEAERKAAEAEAATAKERAAIDKMNGDIVQFLKTDPKFSKGLVTLPGGNQAIFGKMQEHFAKTQEATGEGQVLSFAAAAEQVEKEWEAGLLKFAEHPRGRELLSKALTKSVPTPGAASPKQPQKPAPQQRARQVEPELDGERLLAEATAMIRRNQQARREHN